MGSFFWKPVLIAPLLLAAMATFRWAWAEVEFDGTVGPKGTLSGDMVIPQTQGTKVGNNLFHSFSTFHINTHESALFTGPSSIANIISRVTGVSASTIDGSLDHNMPNASFWLLNPNGILFGQNASLPTLGAFHATTADYLLFEGGGRFGADTSLPENSVLSVANPSAFGFLGSNLGSITLRNSKLSVEDGSGLSLIGGDLEIRDGRLTAEKGEINLVSVGSAGEAVMSANGVDIDAFSQGGVVRLQGSVIRATDLIAKEPGAGSISIRGGELVVEDSEITTNTHEDVRGYIDIDAKQDITLLASTISHETGDSPHINLSAGGDILLRDGSSIFSTSASSADSGDINITAQNLKVTSQSDITTTTHSSGIAGDISINVADTLSISDTSLGVRSITHHDLGGTGNSDTLLGVRSVTQHDFGSAGNIDITARAVNLDGGYLSGPQSFRASGDLSIHADSLTLTNNSQISIFSDGGKGVTMSLRIRDGIFMTGSRIINSGDTLIETSELMLGNNCLIWRVYNAEEVSSGDINIDVETLRLNGGHIKSGQHIESGDDRNNITKKGGSININAQDSVTVEDYSNISTYYGGDGFGNVGDIRISAPVVNIDASDISTSTINRGAGGAMILKNLEKLSLSNDSRIVANTAGPGEGGRVNIEADSIHISGNSSIQSNSWFGSGHAGIITIGSSQSPIGSLTLVDGGYISTTTSGLGDAGEININATGAVTLQTHTQESHISSNAMGSDPNALGSAGAITLNAKELNILGGVIATDTQSHHGEPANIQISVNDLLIEGVSANTLQAIAMLENGQQPQFSVTGITSNATADQQGGRITVNVSNQAWLSSGVISASASGAGGGGDVYIGNSALPVGLLFIDDKSAIFARAQQGNGGNIFIYPDAFLRDLNSRISAGSIQGNAGVVEIDRVDQDVMDTILDLDNLLMSSDLLISQVCHVDRIRQRSSLTVDGQGGLRWSPGGYMPSKMSRFSTDGYAVSDRTALDQKGLSGPANVVENFR
jgi:filamentous hemagglutinin family protein